DPTAYVAPERVEQGIEQALADEASFLENSPFSPLRYRHLAWVSQLRLSWDYANFAWHRLVVNYDAKAQRRLLARFFDRVDWRWLGGLLLSAIALVMAALSLWLLGDGWKRRRTDPRMKSYQRLCRKMARRGLPIMAGETPENYLQRLRQQRPECTSQLLQLERLLISLLYAPGQAGQQQQLAQLRKMIGRL
ncbi:MAG: DUF4129 domain-containing protein, partial [Halopseudomonas sp.]